MNITTSSELLRIMRLPNAADVLMEDKEAIAGFIPALKPCIGFDQRNKYHCFDCYEHLARSVGSYEGDDDIVNLALLLHDIGKPIHYTTDKKGYRHYRGHGEVSKELAAPVLENLHLDTKTKNAVLELIAAHDSIIDPNPNNVRVWVNKLGATQFRRLLDVRRADLSAQSNYKEAPRWNRLYALNAYFWYEMRKRGNLRETGRKE